MSYLYVCEQGATIGITENRFQVKYKDGMVKSIPAETLEVIEVFGKVQITTQCMTECLKRGVNILFYSTKGAYFGRLISTNHVNVQRQRIQAKVTEDEQFRLNFQSGSSMQKFVIRLLFYDDMRGIGKTIFNVR